MTTQHPPVYTIPEDNCPDDCALRGTDSVHFHGDAGWQRYWTSLTPGERDEIRRRSNKYGQTLTASAMMTGFKTPAADVAEQEYQARGGGHP